MGEYETLAVEREGHVTTVFLNRPDKRNAMNPRFFSELRAAFRKLHQDRETRAVVLAGKGEHFSAGLDLTEASALFVGQKGSQETDTLFHHILELQEAMNAVEECRKPVIAAVQGACIGGGLDLIAACDIRLCSRDAYFSLREAKLAIIADLGSLNRLPPIIGPGHTRELAFTGKNIDAERALRIGLVNDVYEDREKLMSAALALAREIAETAPLAVQGAKEVMNYSRDKSMRDGLAYAAARSVMILKGEDLMEAVKAFFEKRKPEFKGR